MGIGYRIKEAREIQGLTQIELGKLVGVTGSAITNYENETSHPKEPVMYKLIEALKVDANYLFQDCVKLPKEANDVTLAEYDHIKKYRALDSHGQETVNIVLDRETARVKSLQEKDNRIAELEASPAAIIEMPRHSFRSRHITEYFRDASAGSGIFILGNEVASKIAISDSDWDDRVDFVIKVNGNSMEPDYMDGDNVMVSQHVEMKYGDVGIFVVNGSVYIKEYGKTELISHNPESPNIQVNEFDNIVCMGKVIGKLDGEYEIIGE
nr:S24 family peptidase [uncultured Acetatifactor sp.]